MLENKKYWVIGISVFILLSIIGGYFAKDYKKQYESEHTARIESDKKVETLKVEKTVLESRLNRSLTAALDSKGRPIRNNDGSVVMNEVLEQYNLQFQSMDEQIKSLSVEKSELQEKVKLAESSKPSEKRFGLLLINSFPGLTGGIGIHQSLGLVDLGVYALNPIEPVFKPSLAVNARF